ncbi:hypothetical protein ACTZU6_28355, partial [Klebsiella pneumoniae]
MGSCAAPSAKGDDKFITTDYLQQCPHYLSQRLISVDQNEWHDLYYPATLNFLGILPPLLSSTVALISPPTLDLI